MLCLSVVINPLLVSVVVVVVVQDVFVVSTSVSRVGGRQGVAFVFGTRVEPSLGGAGAVGIHRESITVFLPSFKERDIFLSMIFPGFRGFRSRFSYLPS